METVSGGEEGLKVVRVCDLIAVLKEYPSDSVVVAEVRTSLTGRAQISLKVKPSQAPDHPLATFLCEIDPLEEAEKANT